MPVTQFNMKDVEKAGLVKFDFLGLTTLTMLVLGEKLVNERGTKLELAKLPLDDRRRYELLGRGETVGVFQLESSAACAMRSESSSPTASKTSSPWSRSTGRDRWTTFRATSTASAAREDPEYLHPLLKPILEETSGVIIYQEQVMQIAQESGRLFARRRRPAAPGHGQEDQGGDGRAARGVHRGRDQTRHRQESWPRRFSSRSPSSHPTASTSPTPPPMRCSPIRPPI